MRRTSDRCATRRRQLIRRGGRKGEQRKRKRRTHAQAQRASDRRESEKETCLERRRRRRRDCFLFLFLKRDRDRSRDGARLFTLWRRGQCHDWQDVSYRSQLNCKEKNEITAKKRAMAPSRRNVSQPQKNRQRDRGRDKTQTDSTDRDRQIDGKKGR